MATSVASQVEVRAATPSDLAAISRIMNHPPEPPLATLLGADRASRLGDLLVRAGITITLADTVVAVLEGDVVGVMDCGGESRMTTTAGQVLRLLPRLLLIVGPIAPRALYGMWLRQQVQFEPVAEAFPVAELYVDEGLRSRGIGGRLLEHAADRAHRSGAPRMSIETGITNPARRLYERHGYETRATKADARYDRLTGSPGRVLMVKEFRPPSAEQPSTDAQQREYE